jgi:hypothetical protein
MGNVIRTTVCVPAELKARMQAVEEPVNWSEVAVAAFEAKLAEIVKKRGAKDKMEAIMRLKASKRKFMDRQYQEGYEAGQGWALNHGEADELMRLADLQATCQGAEWDLTFDPPCEEAFSTAERIAFKILGEDSHPYRAEAREFWDMAIGKEIEQISNDFVKGFVEGALAVWSEVEDQS